MLTSLKVESWKSYAQATLHVDSLSVLIGTNASGKSNLLDALIFLHRVATGLSLTSALLGDGAIPPLRGGLEWAARKPGNRFALTVTVKDSEAQDYEYRLECVTTQSRCEVISEQLDRVRFRQARTDRRSSVAGRIHLFHTDAVANDDISITARLYNEKRGVSRASARSHAILFQLVGQKNRTEIQDGVERVTDVLRDIFFLDPIPSHMRGFSQLSERLESDGGNIAGVIAALPSDDRERIEAILTQYASRLPERDIRRIYVEKVGHFQTDAMLYCEEHFGSGKDIFTVDARGMSDGTLRFLAILLALLTRPPKSLLVVEEVDNGLHPSRSKLLLEMLATVGRDRGVDVMVTTHNPALLDAMGTEMVPFITVSSRDPDTGASQLTLLEDVETLPKLLAQGQVGLLSSQGLIEQALRTSGEHQTQ